MEIYEPFLQDSLLTWEMKLSLNSISIIGLTVLECFPLRLSTITPSLSNVATHFSKNLTETPTLQNMHHYYVYDNTNHVAFYLLRHNWVDAHSALQITRCNVFLHEKIIGFISLYTIKTCAHTLTHRDNSKHSENWWKKNNSLQFLVVHLQSPVKQEQPELFLLVETHLVKWINQMEHSLIHLRNSVFPLLLSLGIFFSSRFSTSFPSWANTRLPLPPPSVIVLALWW